MRRELTLNFCMKSHLMAHVNEVCFFRLYLFNESQSLLERLVRVVVLMTQCVDHEKVQVIKKTGGFIGKTAHIGNVSHTSHSVTENGHFSMHHGERLYLYFANRKGLAGYDFVHHELWHTGIEIGCEAIRQLLMKKVRRLTVCEYLNVTKGAKGT